MLSPDFLDRLWYGKHPLSLLLAPLGWVYLVFMHLRRLACTFGLIPSRRIPVPVIIVGNVTVGGTGKTPLVIFLTNYLKTMGFKPGVISRGYGGQAKHWPQQVRPDSDPHMAGDESVIIARRTACPVAASPDRYQAARELLEHYRCDIILCDDGLQHQLLARDIEIAVIDGVRRFGNGRCLPAGPLRESSRRLKSVDMIITNGNPLRGEFSMEILPGDLIALDGTCTMATSAMAGKKVHAVAGIGNPARFFTLLKSFGMQLVEHEFPDHHVYTRKDMTFSDGLPVIMTEKDAIKCTRYATKNHWYLPIDANVSDTFLYRFKILLKEITDGQKVA